uniref:DALR anticodon binding domain-containing protein n=1 Tax=Heliothis virescens TaxID=7102 RepID=A0A2A4K828_HELVI
MIENALESFAESLFLYLSGQPKDARSLLVKKHQDNLQTHGDFSFPNSVKSWHEFAICDEVVNKEDTTLMQVIGKECGDIVEESINWTLQVNKVKEDNGRIYLFLERPKTICVGLSEALRNIAVLAQQLHEGVSEVHLDPGCEEQCDITSLRAKYVCSVIRNLCALNKVDSKIFVTTKSSSNREGCHRVLCGTVLNSKTGAKETEINADGYIRIRQDEMTLIAQHKYGVRVSTDSKWKEFIAHLGESAAAFELLQTKPSSPVKINFDCSSVGSSKGASFILYNCARLETIIRTYNDRVCDNTYPELPAFDDVDFSLLVLEDEWHLIFNYILSLPNLLRSCVEQNNTFCEFRPHHICSYLCSMVRVFSQYYRKTRILVEPRKHLLPVIFARIHMLKILNETLKTCLNILNIKSVSQM